MSMDASTRARLVGLFVDEAAESVESLRRGAEDVRRGDTGEPLTEFGRVAHGLKGAAAALGFSELARALHELESVTLAVRGEEKSAAERRMERVGEAVELLSQGVAQMQATSMDVYPAEVVSRLVEVLGTAGPKVDPDAVTAPGAAPSPQPPAPFRSASEEQTARPSGGEVAERLSVPSADVDEALRLAASVARAAAQDRKSVV